MKPIPASRRRKRSVSHSASNGAGPIVDNIEEWRRARPDIDLNSLVFSMAALRLGKIIEDDFDQQCARHFGISSNDMRVLLALRRAGPPYARRPTDLFQSLLVTSGAITKQVKRLARKKLVRRLRDPNHGGSWQIQLTAKGKRIADRMTKMTAQEGPLHSALMQMRSGERDAGFGFVVKLLTAMGH